MESICEYSKRIESIEWRRKTYCSARMGRCSGARWPLTLKHLKGLIQDIFADEALTSGQKVRFGEMINVAGSTVVSTRSR